MIPGSNLLNQAFSLIARQTVSYKAYASRTVSDIGMLVTAYADAVDIQGSVQAVPRELFERYGLDFQKNYIMFYVSQNLIDVTRDVSGDRITYNGKNYQCVSKTDWFGQDGWIGIICVQVQDA